MDGQKTESFNKQFQLKLGIKTQEQYWLPEPSIGRLDVVT